MTKFLNISTDNTLGGITASDETVSSQKSIKTYVDGTNMCPDKTHYENITIGVSGATYTAPANGYFGAYNASGDRGAVRITNSSNGFGMTGVYATGFSDGIAFCPCKKGDVVALYYSGTFGSTNGYFRFFYAENN